VTGPLPQLLDCRGIMAELGVKRATAETIIRWVAREHGVIAPDDHRKTFVEREHVHEWLRAHRKTVAA
jgi:hypothetical protein